MVRFLAESRNISRPPSDETWPRTHPVSYSMGTGHSFPAVKWLWLVADQLRLSSVEIKNEWRYTSTPTYALAYTRTAFTIQGDLKVLLHAFRALFFQIFIAAAEQVSNTCTENYQTHVLMSKVFLFRRNSTNFSRYAMVIQSYPVITTSVYETSRL